MKTAIIGSRNITQINVAQYIIEKPTVVISGGAAGVDTLAAQYAKANQIPLIEYLPNYAKYGRIAPHIRNSEIVNSCDVLYAFWDGRSKGTISTYNKAVKAGKITHLITCCKLL